MTKLSGMNCGSAKRTAEIALDHSEQVGDVAAVVMVKDLGGCWTVLTVNDFDKFTIHAAASDFSGATVAIEASSKSNSR